MMLKLYIALALLVIGVSADEAASSSSEASGAPEPYAYAYETDSHAASEQRDQSGKVTGFYTVTDADGRQRRVEYFADDSGFHAKVQTNEVGTKSENSADVEVQASPPTEGQLVYQSQTDTTQGLAAPVVQLQQGARTNSVSYVQQVQPANYGQYGQYGQYTQYTTSGQPVYGYTQYGYASQPAYGYTQYGYTSGQPVYGYNQYSYSAGQPVYGYWAGSSGVNYQAPSGYYKRVVSTVQQAPATYVVGGNTGVVGASRYVSSTSGVVPVGGSQTTRTSSYRSYSTSGVAPVARSSSSSSSSSSNLQGSSNYVVLKK